MSRSRTSNEPDLAAWTAPRVSQPGSDWHARSVEEVARALAADPDNGLTWAEAKRRGATQPAADVPPSSLAWRILLNQLKGGVIVVLLLATVVTWVMGHHGDSVGIGASVVFSVVCGFLTDFRAERALAALKSLTAPTARVIREGLEHEIPASTLQLGDVVVLSAGQIVAADGRLVEVRDLQVDESLLTGESLPVAKSPVPLEPGVGLSDRRNMAFCGTTVSGGYGRMLVTGARDETELGRIGRLVQEHAKEATPLERQAEQLGRQLALLVIGLCTVTTVLGLLRGRPLWLMVETGVILAIAAIPEGLPAVTTVALAAGVRRMARARSLVRRLSSVETLGSVSVICTDKTGTLTENVMRATRVHLSARVVVVTGSGYRPEGEFFCDGERLDVTRDSEIQRLLQVAVLCNNAKIESHEGWHVHGSSTEGALLALAAKARAVARGSASGLRACEGAGLHLGSQAHGRGRRGCGRSAVVVRQGLARGPSPALSQPSRRRGRDSARAGTPVPAAASEPHARRGGPPRTRSGLPGGRFALGDRRGRGGPDVGRPRRDHGPAAGRGAGRDPEPGRGGDTDSDGDRRSEGHRDGRGAASWACSSRGTSASTRASSPATWRSTDGRISTGRSSSPASPLRTSCPSSRP